MLEILMQGKLDQELIALLSGASNLTGHGGARKGGYNLPVEVLEVKLGKGCEGKKRMK
jgi:hypothetical protein